MLTHSVAQSPPLLFTHRFRVSPPFDFRNRFRSTRRSQPENFILCAVDQGQTNGVVAKKDDLDADLINSAADVVRRFYEGVNGRDLSAVVELIGEECVYEDLVFAKPFVGRKAILEFFDKFMNTISKDLQFAIDDISSEDSVAVGVTWHLEWKGKEFPFSKGCSFYRLDLIEGKRQIIYGRDIVEPFIKPGEAALTAIRGVTWLLERFPQLADRI